MKAGREKILVVENDPLIISLVAGQALESAGYRVQLASEAGMALGKVTQISPDLIIADLALPGLSGKDLLVALAARRIEIPVIVILHKGMDTDLVQAFRLGAADFLLWPFRETEVIAVVDRVLKQVRERKERERLGAELKQANQALQSKVQEQGFLAAIGKAVSSLTDQALLFERILEGAIRVTKSDLGWLLVRGDTNEPFILAAQKKLPPSLAGRLNQIWDDGISSLVAASGNSLSIHGEALKRFKVSALGKSGLIVPIKAQKQVIGLACMMRQYDLSFSENDQKLLESVADYASISLVNARLFRALEERVRSLQTGSANPADQWADLLQTLNQAHSSLDRLKSGLPAQNTDLLELERNLQLLKGLLKKDPNSLEHKVND